MRIDTKPHSEILLSSALKKLDFLAYALRQCCPIRSPVKVPIIHQGMFVVGTVFKNERATIPLFVSQLMHGITLANQPCQHLAGMHQIDEMCFKFWLSCSLLGVLATGVGKRLTGDLPTSIKKCQGKEIGKRKCSPESFFFHCCYSSCARNLNINNLCT